MSKVRKTLTRIVSNDRTVYADLKSYITTKATLTARRFTHRFKGTFSDVSTSVGLAMRQKSEYGIKLLLDLPYYSQQAGEVFKSHEDAFDHFKRIGQSAGYNPHPLFDTNFYLSQKPDLGSLSVIDHYFNSSNETDFSPSPYFDSVYYRSTYPWTANFNPLAHFLSTGYISKHNPFSLFDAAYYFQENLGFFGEATNPVLHYISEGWRMGLNPHPLVDISYIAAQMVPGKSIETFDADPLLAFMKADAEPLINPNCYFDTEYFRLGLEGSDAETVRKLPMNGRSALNLFLSLTDCEADPSAQFSERRYKEMYPDIKEMNGLYHYLRHGCHEGRQIFSSMGRAASEQLQEALEIDPEVVHEHQNISLATVEKTPRVYDPAVQAMIDIVKRRGAFIPDIVYLLPGFHKGGAEKYGAKLINCVAKANPNQKILVISTDNSQSVSRDWINAADNVMVLQFENAQLALSLDSRTKLLSNFLMWCDPAIIINNNSHVGWEMYKTFGKALANRIRLTACLYCYEFDAFGHKVGYARKYIRHTMEHLDTVFVDNSFFGPKLVEDFKLGPKANSLFRVLFQPIEAISIAPNRDEITDRPRVLWAARLVVQKNVALLRDIAIEMPGVDFIVWAIGAWDSKIAGGPPPSNIHIVDENTSFEDMASRNMHAFLLTSDWEGLPTTLIEATNAGLPVVTSDVGGAGDIVSPETGWPVARGNKDHFIAAIDECLSDRVLAADKVEKAQSHILTQHSQESYLSSLQSYGLLEAQSFSEAVAQVGGRKFDSSVKVITSQKVLLAKTTLDVTLVVNAHREGHYLIPTLQAARQALLYTQAEGLSCEILVALDNPDDETLNICKQFSRASSVRLIQISVRDLGLARNEAVRSAHGEYIAFMDGDDLMTRNWLVQGIRTGRTYGPEIVMHPAMNYIFGSDATYIFLHRDMMDPEFGLSSLIAENYWTALSMARREIYLKYPFDENLLKSGLAYEDWSWNALTIANGVTHKIIHNTAHFVRRKSSGSLLQQTVASGALPRLYHLRHTDIST